MKILPVILAFLVSITISFAESNLSPPSSLSIIEAIPVVPMADFDLMMYRYWTNGVPDVIRLTNAIYETAGSSAWYLREGDSIVGAGIDKTIIRRMWKSAELVINGWTLAGRSNTVISDLTIDVNAGYGGGTNAPDAIGGLNWKDSVIERVKVIRLGCTDPIRNGESFGIILSDSTNCIIRDCIITNNVEGYVSAYCIGGRDIMVTNSSAYFSYQTNWDQRLQAFTVGGGKTNIGSVNLIYANNKAENAYFGFFGDTGYMISNLFCISNTISLRNNNSYFQYHVVGDPVYNPWLIVTNFYKVGNVFTTY